MAPSADAQHLGPVPATDDQLIEDDQEQRRRPDVDQVEVQRRMRGHEWREGIERPADERAERPVRVPPQRREAGEAAEGDRRDDRDVVGEDRADARA